MNNTVAVLGLGRMGVGIASRLLHCGYNVIIWNRSPEKGQALLQQGAVWADTPAEAAKQTTVIFSMVADDNASAALWMGEEGALKNMQPGSFVIECSTLSAGYVKQLAAVAAAKDLCYIDCPVTGLPQAAASDQLTLLVGAEKNHLQVVQPVLDCMAVNTRYFGAVGTGTAYKLIINLMGAVQIAALAEGLALADKLDLDRETVIAAIENSAAASPQVVRYTRKMAEQKFADNPAFTVALRYKDALYGLQLAEAAGSPALLGKVAADWFAAASKTNGAKDEAVVINNVLRHPL